MSKNLGVDKKNAVNYRMADTDACCSNCEHFNEGDYCYGQLFGICDKLCLEMPDNYTCDLFKYEKKVEE